MVLKALEGYIKELGYTAIRGAGATCNGRPIRVSDVTELRRALVGTGFPHDRTDVTASIERVRRLVTACQDIRRAGSPALDISWVAAGRLDAHCESLAPLRNRVRFSHSDVCRGCTKSAECVRKRMPPIAKIRADFRTR